MVRPLLLLLIPGCQLVTGDDAPGPPDVRIVIEPDTIEARQDAQQRSVFEMLVRMFNDGPGDAFTLQLTARLGAAAASLVVTAL